MVMAVGVLSLAWVAGPSSPLNPYCPFPATTVTVPLVLSFRAQSGVSSTSYRLPAESVAMFRGTNAVSPSKQEGPVVLSFVTLLMIPLASTLRINGSGAVPGGLDEGHPTGVSTQYTFPLGSAAIEPGKHVEALVASPPSPEVAHFPFPAKTLIFPLLSTFGSRNLGRPAHRGSH